MMKISNKFRVLPIMLVSLTLSMPVAAEQRTVNVGSPVPANSGDSLERLIEYFQRLGLYLGFDLDKSPDENPKANSLLNMGTDDATKSKRLDDASELVNSYLGAIPVAVTGKKATLVDPKIPREGVADVLNNLANATFKLFPYNSPTPNQITANALIDQQQFQQDPVSQSILNILTTPDTSWCLDNKGQLLPAKECPPLYRGKIISNSVGTIPNPYYLQEWNQQVLGQLNSNSLIAPLMYSYEKTGSQNNNANSKENPQLNATDQAEEAANFIRYASSQVLPAPTIASGDFWELYARYKGENGATLAQQQEAKTMLENYFAGLRVYAAQQSVVTANLYSILTRRMSQPTGANKVEMTSQALSEFTMAAWRLKKLNGDKETGEVNEEWLKQINSASSATVQKEMAVLLAEINYQMYLSRQQQERLLMTNTMLLMQNMKNGAPSMRNIREEMAVGQAAGASLAP